MTAPVTRGDTRDLLRDDDTLTCVPGLMVGHAQDREHLTGSTVVFCPGGATGGMVVVGSAPGTRQMDALVPGHVVGRVDGVVFTGGSSLGLRAADGAVDVLRDRGLGLTLRDGIILPILPTAVIFDLRLGPRASAPDATMGAEAARNALDHGLGPVPQGNVGVGWGASVGKVFGMDRACKSGLGSMGIMRSDGLAVGALVVVNAFGDVRDPDSGRLLAGARSAPDSLDMVDTAELLRSGRAPRPSGSGPFSGRSNGSTRGGWSPENTTLALVATNAAMDSLAATKVAAMASGAFYRCLSPAGTMMDGDLVIALSLGSVDAELHQVGALAVHCLEQAILRAVRFAEPAGGLPSAPGFSLAG